MSALDAVRTLSSAWPSPTNAQALAALDSMVVETADQAIADGMPEDVARRYYAPDGILPRMRLLAFGWQKKGDKMKSPSDAAWWKKKYQYPLWAPLETLTDQASRAGVEIPWGMDDAEAAGDAGSLSYSLSSLMQADLPPVNEAPCPRWIIPPGRGQLPIPNPSCVDPKPVRDIVDKLPLPRQRQSSDLGWLWTLVLIGLAVYDDRRGRR